MQREESADHTLRRGRTRRPSMGTTGAIHGSGYKSKEVITRRNWSLMTQSEMRGCMFCVLLISILLFAYLLNVIASSAFCSNRIVAVDGMGIARNEVEHDIARMVRMLTSFKREPVQTENGDRIVELIARVESMLMPFESEEQESLLVFDSPELRLLRAELQMPNGVDSQLFSKLGITNVASLGAENSDRKGMNDSEKLSKRVNDSGRESGIRRASRGIIETAPHTIIDNQDSNFQNNIHFRIDDLRHSGLLAVLSENLADGAPPERFISLSGEKGSGNEALAIEPLLDKIRETFLVDPEMPGSRIPEKVEDRIFKTSHDVNDSATWPGEDAFAQLVRASLVEKIPVKDNLRDENESGDKDQKLVVLAEISDGPLGFAWSHPLTVSTLSVCVLVLLALLGSIRLRKTRRIGRRGLRRLVVDDDDEMLVPQVVKHSAAAAAGAEGVGAPRCTPSTPLWAQYLGRASSPHPVAIHAPRSTVRLMRDALRAYGHRQRSRSHHRHHHHHPHATGAGIAGGDYVPLADSDGPVPDAPLGTLHV